MTYDSLDRNQKDLILFFQQHPGLAPCEPHKTAIFITELFDAIQVADKIEPGTEVYRLLRVWKSACSEYADRIRPSAAHDRGRPRLTDKQVLYYAAMHIEDYYETGSKAAGIEKEARLKLMQKIRQSYKYMSDNKTRFLAELSQPEYKHVLNPVKRSEANDRKERLREYNRNYQREYRAKKKATESKQ